MGFAKRADGTAMDTGAVTIENIETGDARGAATDGGGFYGGVDLPPGQYVVKAELDEDTLYSCVVSVTAGTVASADLGVENVAPMTIATTAPAAPNGGNGWFTSDVTVSLNATDNCAGVSSTEYSTDGNSTWLPYTGSFVISAEGTTTVSYRSTDRAGNVEAARSLTVKIDKTAPVITLKPSATFLLPNHAYRALTVADMVASASDGQDGDLISSVVIEKVTSDEPDNAPSLTDGVTTNDIDIAAECKSVKLRAERDLLKDGRVYSVTLRARDSAGNTTRAVFKVTVPVIPICGAGSDRTGSLLDLFCRPVVDSGVAFTVNGDCP
jgi:hypothetical protein